MTKEDLKQFLADEGYDDILIFENPDFANAFVGISTTGQAIYDYERMIECLVNEDDMSYEEAADFISYNTVRSCEYTKDSPIIMCSFEDLAN